jgi:NDP-sugar pyrophosphorylase family protein
MISPFQTAGNSDRKLFSTHMEALKNMREYINEFKEEYVVLMDSDHVLNIDITNVIRAHEQTGASVTFVTQRASASYTSKAPRMMLSSVAGKVTDIAMCSSYNEKNPELSLNIFVMKTVYLRKIIEEADAYSIDSLAKMFLNNYKFDNYRVYRHDGYVASVSSFLDYYNCSIELAKDEKASVLRAVENVTAKDVWDAVKAGDEVAIEIAETFGDWLGKGLAMIAAVVNPEIFVIGGGVSKAGDILISYIQPAYLKYAFVHTRSAKFAIAELGNDAGIYGAAAMILK